MTSTVSPPQTPAERITPILRSVLRSSVQPLALAAAGIVSIRIYQYSAYLHALQGGIASFIGIFLVQFSIYLAACFLVLRRKPAERSITKPSNLLIVSVVIAFSILFRAELVDEPPYLSSDVYRYSWDGRVQAAGINPYRYIPSDESIAYLRDQQIYAYINRRDFAHTIYPPAAQMIFLAINMLSPSDVHAFKVGMSVFDGITILAILLALVRLGLDPSRVLVFAWHPLMIWEGAHSGHIESAWIAFVTLAILARVHKNPLLTGVALALATLVKLYPLLLLPAFLYPQQSSKRPEPGASWAKDLGSRLRQALWSPANGRLVIGLVVTIVAAYLPYLSAGTRVIGYLPGYLEEEGFVQSGSRYFLLELSRQLVTIHPIAYSCLAAFGIAGLALWTVVRITGRPIDAPRYSLALIGLFLILSSPRFGWYFAALIPLLCFVPRTGWLYLSGACVFLYSLWVTGEYPGIPLWLGGVLYGPTAGLLLWEYWKRRDILTVG